MPLVSFAVLNYNNGRFLRECVDSILSQEGGHDFEIVIVDDASTDESASVASSIADPRVRFIRHERNLGHIVTVNDALAESTGTFIARIDSDDRYRPNFLTDTLRVFDRLPTVGLTYGDAAIINPAGKIMRERSDSVHGGCDFVGNELVRLLERNFICAPTVIARREAWKSAPPLPIGLAFHDWYFTVMMARKWDFCYLDNVIADYRVHPGNLHTAITKNRQEEPSIFRILDRVFGETEIEQSLETAKQRRRKRVYGSHYLTLADKYFGLYMNADAKRCYWRAVQNRPAYLLRFGVQRRLAATMVGRDRYDASKSILRSLLVRTL